MPTPSGLKLTGVATPPDFAWPEDKDYDVLIGQNAATKFWLVPDAAKVTQAGGFVTAGVDRASGYAYAGGPSPRGPYFLASTAPNGRPALNVPLEGERKFVSVPNILPWAGAFTVLTLLNLDASGAAIRRIFKVTAAGNPNAYMAVLGGANNKLDAGIYDADGRQARALTATNSVAQSGVLAAMMCWEPTTKTLWASIDMGNSWVSGTQAAFVALTGSPVSITIGATDANNEGLIGKILDAWVGNVSLHATENAALLASFRTYFADRYLLTY